MSGLGDNFLPLPQFDRSNPYWRDPRINGVKTEYQPRLSARDFLYATVWESMRRYDWLTAMCVRLATVLTVKVNWYFDIRNQILELKNKGAFHEEPLEQTA